MWSQLSKAIIRRFTGPQRKAAHKIDSKVLIKKIEKQIRILNHEIGLLVRGSMDDDCHKVIAV